MNKKLVRWVLAIVMLSSMSGCAGLEGLAPSSTYWATDHTGVSKRPFWKENAYTPEEFLIGGDEHTFIWLLMKLSQSYRNMRKTGVE